MKRTDILVFEIYMEIFRPDVKKNPAPQDSPPAAGRFSDMIPFRRSAIQSGAFLFHRTQFPMKLKNLPGIITPERFFNGSKQQ